MPRSAIGIDVGSRTVTVAEVRTSSGTWSVSNFGGVELPSGAVVAGEITDVDVVASAITSLLSSAGIRRRAAWFGVGHELAVMRTIALPPHDDLDDLRALLRYEAVDHLPFPVEDAVLDVHLLDDDDLGERRHRGLLVGVERRIVASLLETVERAGLRPLGVDLNAFAVLRALTDDIGPRDPESLTIDVGAGVTTLIVHRGMQPLSVETISTGGDDVTLALVESMDMDFAGAESTKRTAAIGNVAGVTDRIVTERTGRVIDEIAGTLERMRGEGTGRMLTGAVATGGFATMPGFVPRLEAALGLPVDVGSPLDRFRVRRTMYGPDELSQLGPTLTTAVGLAASGLD